MISTLVELQRLRQTACITAKAQETELGTDTCLIVPIIWLIRCILVLLASQLFEIKMFFFDALGFY